LTEKQTIKMGQSGDAAKCNSSGDASVHNSPVCDLVPIHGGRRKSNVTHMAESLETLQSNKHETL